MVLKKIILRNLFRTFKSSEILNKSSHALLFKLAGSFFGYLFLILITRLYGPESWGIFTICLAILSISSMVSRVGIDIAIIKFVSALNNKISDIKGVYSISLRIIFIFSFLFSLILYLTSDFISDQIFKQENLSIYIKYLSFAVIPFSILNTNVSTFRGLKKIKEFAFFQHTSIYLSAILIFLLINFLLKVYHFSVPIFSYLIALSLMMIITSFRVFKIFKKVISNYAISYKTLLKTSYPMMFSSSILLLMAWSDSLMIGIFKSEYDVGIYSVALRLAMTTGIILGAVNSILAPKISECYNNNRLDEFKKLIKHSTKIIFLTTLPVIVIMFTFSKFFLSIFGPQFVVAQYTLIILLAGQTVNAMSGSVGFILQMTGKERVYQYILLVALFFNILLNIFLIPRYGIEGAAIASAFSLLFWNISSMLYIYFKYNIVTFFTFK